MQALESPPVELLEETYGYAASAEHFEQFTPAGDCSPAALNAEDGIINALFKKLHSERHLELKYGEPFHSLEAEWYYI